jgi:hypothetical protein
LLQDWLAGVHTYWGTDAESLANYEEFLTVNAIGDLPITSTPTEESS